MSLPKPRVPKLEELLSILNRANRRSDFLVKLEAIALLVMLIWLPWSTLIESPLATCIVIGLALAQSGMGYFQLIFLNKKEIRHLQDHTSLGNYNRQDLLELIRQVLSRMNFKNTSIKVYLLADKDINASAIKVGFSKLFPSLNAVYLNRSVLYLLQPDELKFLIGHEFGHVLKYRETWRDYEIIHLAVTAVVGLWALCILNATDGYVFFAVVFIQFAIHYLLSLPSGHLSQPIEYLCDYNGMKVSNLSASVNATLKLGHESEAHQDIFFKTFEASKNGQPLSPNEISNIYEEALPYGNIDAKQSEKDIQQLTQHARQQKSDISLGGFVDFIRSQDSENENFDSEIINQMNLLNQMPLLPWRKLIEWNPKLDPKNLDVNNLLNINQSYPEGFLFRLESEIPSNHSSHPSFSNRINFLAAHQHD